MSTFGAMKTRIADDIVRDDLASQIANAINDAIELQEGERYKFNEKRYRILTVADQEYYDLAEPTLLDNDSSALEDGEALLEVDYVMATVNSEPYPLCQRTQQWFNENALSTHEGQPSDYTIYGQQLRIFPVPDAVYTFDLGGLGRLGPNPLSSDGHTNAWMTDGAGIIRGQAKLLLYRDILRDAEGVQIARGQIVEAGGNPDPASAKRKMAAQAYTGRMRAWNL